MHFVRKRCIVEHNNVCVEANHVQSIRSALECLHMFDFADALIVLLKPGDSFCKAMCVAGLLCCDTRAA